MKRETNRMRLVKKLVWDYNYELEEVDRVLTGKKNRVGHFTRSALFIRSLETFSWFTILELFSTSDIRKLLTTDTIQKLRSPSLKRRYE